MKFFNFALICLLGYLFIGLFSLMARAQSMTNDTYMIQTENININPSDTSSEKNINTKPPVDKSNSSETPTHPFTFSIDQTIIDFGTLSPTNPIIRTNNLKISEPTEYGYSVLGFEDHSLKRDSPAGEAFIPNTTCDNGQCSELDSSLWTNALTYGFGYRCDNVIGFDCERSFLEPNFYKHFSDISNNDNLATVMKGIGSEKKEVRISYKVNISGTQEKGNYLNTITYIAVPNF